MPEQEDPDVEPAPPEDDPAIPTPPDPADPLRRETDDDEEEGHPGIDPVTRPVPPD